METAHELSANEVASAYFQSTVNEMEWAEVLSTVHDMVQEMLGDSPSLPLPPPPTPPSPLYFISPLRHIPSPLPSPPPPPTPPYSPPSHVPSWSGFNTHPQSVDSLNGGSAYDGSILLEAAPNMFEPPLTASAEVNAEQAPPVTYQAPVYDPNIMQSGHLYDQAYEYSQGQNLPNQWPVNDAPIAIPASFPAAPLHTYNNMPVLTLPEAIGQNLSPAGVLNGEVVYRYLPDTPTHSDPPPASTSGKRKCKRRKTTDDDQPYIKKPPNAFMLYRKEQRQNVIAEMGITDSAMINTILGQRWRSLSAEEKAKYFEEADKEKLLHSQRHPNWSSSDNYGKKKKRCRTKDRTSATASTSTSGEDTQVAKRQRTSAQTAVTEPSTSQTNAAQSTMPVPLCYMCCLPQVYGPMCLPNSLPSTSTAIFPHIDPTGTQMVNHPVSDHRAT